MRRHEQGAAAAGAACTVDVSYHPAPWEQRWRANVSLLADASELWIRGCAAVLDESDAVRAWLLKFDEQACCCCDVIRGTPRKWRLLLL